MIPERLTPKVTRLGEIADRNEGNDVGTLALELASYIAEEGHLEPGSATAIVELEARVDARFTTHELAITELSRRLGESRTEPEATVFGIPVTLAEDSTPDRIREAIAELPAGLDKEATVTALEEQGLLTRTPTKGA